MDRRKEDMKVLVTGADGFIGSHLTESLLVEGYDVRALAQYNSFNYWGWLEDIQQTSNLVHEFSQINTKRKKVERVKKVNKIAEDAKVQVRNARREYNDQVKKNKEISEVA